MQFVGLLWSRSLEHRSVAQALSLTKYCLKINQGNANIIPYQILAPSPNPAANYYRRLHHPRNQQDHMYPTRRSWYRMHQSTCSIIGPQDKPYINDQDPTFKGKHQYHHRCCWHPNCGGNPSSDHRSILTTNPFPQRPILHLKGWWHRPCHLQGWPPKTIDDSPITYRTRSKTSNLNSTPPRVVHPMVNKHIARCTPAQTHSQAHIITHTQESQRKKPSTSCFTYPNLCWTKNWESYWNISICANISNMPKFGILIIPMN